MSMLAKEPKYYPLEKGIYEVAPGLRPLGADLGAGILDLKIFQITEDFKKFRDNKFASYTEDIAKYRPKMLGSGQFKDHLKKFLLSRLQNEYPELVQHDGLTYKFLHTGDEISPLGWKIKDPKNLPIESMDDFDFLSLQFPEDWALTELTADGKDSLAYLNVCAPSHWAPYDKLNLSFLQVHQVIPGSERLTNVSRHLVEAMINKGPFVRFVWSFVTDKNLNHHPIAPPGIDQDTWKGRSWNASQKPPFHLRIERQTTWGFPEFNRALFTIRISFIDGAEIIGSPEKREKLKSSLLSMTPESRAYKGVDVCFPDLIESLS